MNNSDLKKSERDKQDNLNRPQIMPIIYNLRFIFLLFYFLIVRSISSIFHWLKKEPSTATINEKELDKSIDDSTNNLKSQNTELQKSETQCKNEENLTQQSKTENSEDNKQIQSSVTTQDTTKSLDQAANSQVSEAFIAKKTNTQDEMSGAKTTVKFFSTKEHSKSTTTILSIDFKNPDILQEFLQEINELVLQQETQYEHSEQNGSSQVGEDFIQQLISITKNPYASASDFWKPFEQMDDYDIKGYVSKLSPNKSKGKYSSSELDLLWRRFTVVEFEPSCMENKKKIFAAVLKNLSEEQLKASFDSTDFLNSLNQEIYCAAAMNTLNRKQLGLFASDPKKQKFLNTMIRKLSPDHLMLGKLIEMMPFAAEYVKKSLMEKIAVLPCKIPFKHKLTQLAEHYIKMNHQKTITKSVSLPVLNNKNPSKWASVNANIKPVYSNIVIKKENWTNPAFDQFIRGLNATTFFVNQTKIIEDLNSLTDDRIKMILERASSPDSTNLLKHLWILESKPTNHSSYIECRLNRLQIVLENLTEDQLKNSLLEGKFWDIFKDKDQPYSKLAAKILTPEQFKIIITHIKLERHRDFTTIIRLIPKENAIEKKRLTDIIEIILPSTSPWLALDLEWQIKAVMKFNQNLYKRFNTLLRDNLRESMKNEEVNRKYIGDTFLNFSERTAITSLLNVLVTPPTKSEANNTQLKM